VDVFLDACEGTIGCGLIAVYEGYFHISIVGSAGVGGECFKGGSEIVVGW